MRVTLHFSQLLYQILITPRTEKRNEREEIVNVERERLQFLWRAA
jgi:hypothetical protein